MARSVDVDLSIDDFQRVSDRVPLLADFKPSGPYVMEDLHQAGGIPGVMKLLLAVGALHGDCITVTGTTVADNLSVLPHLAAGQQIVRSFGDPLKPVGHLQILRGNLAPEGAVAKITGKEGLRFSGPARVYDSEELMLASLERKEIQKGDVIVIRYEGPKGGPGMPEMLTPTSAIMGAGLGKDVALITDGRFSGGSHGFIVGHVTPAAYSPGRRTYCADPRGRQNHHRRREELTRCRPDRGRAVCPGQSLENAALQGRPRYTSLDFHA